MHSSSKPCSSKKVGWLSSSKIIFPSLECFGLPKTGVGALWSSSWGLWRLWVFKMEHWRGFGPPTWSLGAPWASNLGSLGSFEVSKSGSCNGLRLQVGVSKPAFAEDMVLQTPMRQNVHFMSKKQRLCIGLDLQAGVFGVLWVCKMGPWRGFGPPSWGLGALWISKLRSLGGFGASKLGSWNALGLQVEISRTL